MKTNVYVLKDIAIDKVLWFFSAINEKELNRIVDGFLLSDGSNPFKNNLQDLQILQTGELDDNTGLMVGFPSPVFVFNVQARVDDLEQRRIKAKAKEEAYKAVVANLKASLEQDPDFIDEVKKKEGLNNEC